MLMRDHDPRKLLERVRDGDELAAVELLEQYVDRLIELARGRLSPKLARRLDPEDIVQSAYRSFFRLARADHYEVDDGDQLWHLLAAITVNKARKAATRHTANKRTVESEQSTARDSILATISPEALARDPAPEEAVILVEETELMMNHLSLRQRLILQLQMQGHTIEETARLAECSERSVHRALEFARSDLEQRLWGDGRT